MTGDPSGAEMRSPNDVRILDDSDIEYIRKWGIAGTVDMLIASHEALRAMLNPKSEVLNEAALRFPVFIVLDTDGLGMLYTNRADAEVRLAHMNANPHAKLGPYRIATFYAESEVSPRSSGGAPNAILPEQSVTTFRDAAQSVAWAKGPAQLVPPDQLVRLCDSHESLRTQVSALRQQLDDWRNREAKVCPEDVGFEEYIGTLTREITELDETLRDERVNVERARQEAAALTNQVEALSERLAGANRNATTLGERYDFWFGIAKGAAEELDLPIGGHATGLRPAIARARQEAETLRRVADSKSDQLKSALNSLKEIATITGDATQANQAKIVAAVKRVVEEAETLRGQLDAAQKDAARWALIASYMKVAGSTIYADRAVVHLGVDTLSVSGEFSREEWKSLRDDEKIERILTECAARVAAP